MKTKKTKRKRKRKKRSCVIYFLCWIIIPAAVIFALFLDGVGLYCFNTERLIAIGVCILVMLLPFFGEITVKGVSFKKDNDSKS